MKKTYMLMALLCCALHLPSTAQERYAIDGDIITASKVVEGIAGTTEDIYTRAKTYVARAYNDGKEVIQTDDKDNGLIIVKGIYPRVNTYSLGFWYIKAYHTIRIDIKEGRARIICSVSSLIPNSSQHTGDTYEYRIAEYYPITDRANMYAGGKKVQDATFRNLINIMNSSVDAISKALKEGGVLETEKADW